MQQKIISHKPIGNCKKNSPGVVPYWRNHTVYIKGNCNTISCIPNIQSLLRSWERQDDDQEIHTMKEEMITSLKTRFAGVEENKLLSIATIVNRRFKGKFSVIISLKQQ